MIQSNKWVLHNLKKSPYKSESYDSLLERNYMMELETLGGVISWTKKHNIKIPYKIFWFFPHTYHPDFLVTYADGSQEIHETKWAGFLYELSTHAKRIAGDKYAREHNMKYKFIENSWWALFCHNNALENLHTQGYGKRVNSFDDL